MPAPYKALFGIVDVLSSTLSALKKTLLLQTGDGKNAVVESNDVEMWQPFGFASRPSKPTNGGASCAQALVVRRSDHDACIGGRDIRAQAIYGNLKDGEACMFAGGVDGSAQARVLCKAEGSIYAFTALGNVAGGASIAMRVGADGSFGFQSPFAEMSADAAGNITIGNGKAGITISSTGTIKLQGKIIQVQASGVAAFYGSIRTFIGTLTGTPADILPTNAALKGTVGTSGLPSTNVQIGG